MSKLPLLSAKELSGILEKLGFEKIRQKGSHAFFRHPDRRAMLVPVHPGEKIDRGLLNKIIKKDLWVSIEEFMNNC